MNEDPEQLKINCEIARNDLAAARDILDRMERDGVEAQEVVLAQWHKVRGFELALELAEMALKKAKQ